ncbi:MAG: hypothetical protein MJZ13_03450 [Bacteroidales bacterium]|nr:hypothetical protein [Bacteroidales bacterium]
MKYISYSIAATMTIMMMLIFINLDGWMQMAAQLPFMKIDPTITGGEVVDSIVSDNYKLWIHEGVHPGLFEDKSRTITQIDIEGDYYGKVTVNGKQYELNATSHDVKVNGEEYAASFKRKNGWTLRIE